MTAGRKPTPDYLKVLEGNPGKRPLAVAIPEPEVATAPCPPHLTGYARECWLWAMGALTQSVKVFTPADGLALEMLCLSYGHARDCYDAMKDPAKGTVYVSVGRNGTQYKSRPEVAQFFEAQRNVRAFLGEFGLTPAARQRLRGIMQPDMFDELDRFMRSASARQQGHDGGVGN